MDIYNSTMTSSVAPSTVKVAGTAGTSKPETQGNALPELGTVAQKSEAPQTQTTVSPPNAEQLNELVDKANESFSAQSSNLKFSVVEGTNISVVRVEDSETGELIRQFPSEEMVAFAKAMDEMKQGAMLEERA